MRRKDREVKDFETIKSMIDECDIIRIGLADKDCPYIVPMNFAYVIENEEITFYVHGAMEGRKYELMKRNGKCSFEMDIPLKLDCIYESKSVTMRYRSVMGTADIEFLEKEEKEAAIDHIFMARYKETRDFSYNKNSLPHTAVAKLKVTELSAKMNL